MVACVQAFDGDDARIGAGAPCSWPWPTSTPITCAAPARSRQSVQTTAGALAHVQAAQAGNVGCRWLQSTFQLGPPREIFGLGRVEQLQLGP